MSTPDHRPAASPRPPQPRIDRSITLHLMGDGGAANAHRICGWIAMRLAQLCGSHTRTAIWNGDAMARNVRAVGRGQVDVAIVTPAAFVAAALDGRPPFVSDAYPDLRALGVVPQRDRMVFAVDANLGVATFEDLRRSKPALTVATAPHDGDNLLGLAGHKMLRRAGVDIVGWGGALLADGSPFESLDRVRTGAANAILHEAVMLPGWQEIASRLTFLPIERHILDGLSEELSWPSAVVPAGYFPGAPEFETLDFSDFLVLGRTDLADDVAYALAWVLGETRHMLEAQYRHIPPERSPVTYPLDPVVIGRTPIPLHPGAATYYQALPGDR